MTRLELDTIALELPAGWASAVLMLHAQGDPIGDPPFVPTLIVAKRLDVESNASLDTVLANDIAILEGQHQAFALREQDRFHIGKSEARAAEFDFTDARGIRLRQKTVLRWVGEHLYAATATSLADASFARVRTTLMQLVESLTSRA
jgi:hypothetical protein